MSLEFDTHHLPGARAMLQSSCCSRLGLHHVLSMSVCRTSVMMLSWVSSQQLCCLGTAPRPGQQALLSCKPWAWALQGMQLAAACHTLSLLLLDPCTLPGRSALWTCTMALIAWPSLCPTSGMVPLSTPVLWLTDWWDDVRQSESSQMQLSPVNA